MKQCPTCKTNYTDDTLSFCLQDGAQLALVNDAPTVLFNDAEAETVVRIPQTERVNFDTQETHAAQNREPQSQINYAAPTEPPKKSNTAMVVLLTIFGMFLLFGAGLGAWFMLRDKGEIAQNKNVVNTNKQTPNSNAKPSPSASATSTATPTPTPTPAPEFDAGEVKSEVSSAVNSWKSAAESQNLNSYMNRYADTVDYYNRQGISRSAVRDDKQRAFSLYDSMEINISNMRVTPGDAGDTATAVFDKEWFFEGADSYSEGKVQTQLQLVKSGGQWLIRSERDLKVYYTKK